MARLTTTDGKHSIETTLTDNAAAAICDRIPHNNKDKGFASSIAAAFRQWGSRLTHNRRVWLHVMAYAQLRREQPAAAPVVPAVPAAAPVQPISVAPKAPAVAAPVNAAPGFVASQYESAAKGLTLSMFFYYIPDVAIRERKCTNPSGFLRTRGMRLDGSVWLMPTGSIPQTLVNTLQNAGASVYSFPYDASATAGLLQAAVEFTNREIAGFKARAEASRAAAAAELVEAGNTTTAQRTYEKKIEAIAKRLENVINQVEKGAGLMRVAEAVNTPSLRSTAETVRAATITKAAAYVNATEALKTIGTTDANAMAAVMAADEGNALIAADMIQDADVDGTRTAEAESIRAAFSEGDDAGHFDDCEEGETHEGPETFSLVDAE